MELIVYKGEIFQRGIVRYIRFSLILSLVIILSIINNNAVGAIILIFLIGGYLYFSSTLNKKITIKITENGLIIGPRVHLRETLNGYVLEANKNNGQIKNIVFLSKNNKHIHTIADDITNLKAFIEVLENYIQMLPSYEQSFREKMMKKFQI